MILKLITTLVAVFFLFSSLAFSDQKNFPEASACIPKLDSRQQTMARVQIQRCRSIPPKVYK